MKRVRVLVIVMLVLGAGLLCEIRAGMFDEDSRAVLEQIRSTIDKHLESQPIEPIPEPVKPNRAARVRNSPDQTPSVVPVVQPVPSDAPSPARSAPLQPIQVAPPPSSHGIGPHAQGPSNAPATPVPVGTHVPMAFDRERSCIVLHVKSVPVTNLAQALKQTFQMESQFDPLHGLVIVPESTSNSLLMSGPKNKIEEARRLVEQMDHPPAMVRLEVRITESAKKPKQKPEETLEEKPSADAKDAKEIAKPEAAAEEENTVFQAELTTLDNQAAKIHLGRAESRIVAANVTSRGTANSVNQVMVGTEISLTPRIEGDNRVVLSLNISDSRSGPDEEGVVITEVAGKPIRSPNMDQLKCETTVQLEDGEPILVGGLNRDGKNGREKKISVTAHILRPGGPGEGNATKAKEQD